MSSGEPNAAWHPAFMPHTVETPAPVASVPTEPATSTTSTKEPLALDIDTSSHDAHDESGVDAWFPEYDAGSPWTEQPPTNSLGETLEAAAPAVEEAAPEQPEAPAAEPVPRESTPEPTPASSAPAVESTPESAAPAEPTETTPVASSVASPVGEVASKHFSTISFTRTVANDVNWDAEEDEPEWNITRTDTDPFQQFMPATVDRSNSFPVVPPQPAEAAEAAAADGQVEATQYEQQPLASTHAMDIIQEVDSEVNAEAKKEEAEAAAADVSPSAEVGEEHTEEGIDAWGLDSDAGDTEGDSFFAGAAAEDKAEEVETPAWEVPDARFEEGVPLIPHQAASEVVPEPVAETVAEPASEAPAQEPETAPAATNDPFGESNGDNDDDFFNNAGTSAEPKPETETAATAAATAPAPAPPSFERKSTFQVIQQSLNVDDGEEEDSFFASRVEDGPIHEEPEPIETAEPAETAENNEKTNGAAPDLADQWAALLDDEDELLLEDSDPTTETESKALDPSAFFGDDDEGFLEDDAEEPTGEPVVSQQQQQQPAATRNRYLPQASPAQAQQSQQAANPYLPTTPFTAAQPVVPSPYATPSAAPNQFPAYGYGTSPSQAPPVQDPSRPTPHKAQSFADKSKGGYSSPYDLPMDIVKQPKKRQSMQHLQQQSPAATSAPPQGPPPRSSSMQAYSPSKDTFPATAAPPPPAAAAANRGMAPPPVPAAASAPPPAALSTPPVRSDSFFEDLPMLPKVRPASRHSQHSPAQNTPYGLPPQTPNTLPYPPQGQGPPPPTQASPYAPAPQQSQTPSVPPPNSHYAPPVASTPVAAPPQQQQVPQTPNATIGGLVAPPRANPYASLQNGPPAATPPAGGSNRYSPSPNQLPKPGAGAGVPSRYSPAPPPRVPSAGGYAPAPTPPILAHQPRTSSPLAHFEMSYEKPRASSIGHNVTHADGQQQPQLSAERRSSSSVFESRLNRVPSLPPTREEEEESPASASDPPLPTQQYQRPMSSGNGAYPPAPASQSSQTTSQYSPLKPRQTPPPQQQQQHQQQTSAYSQATLSPPKRILSYAPQNDGQHSPPRRSQTQSPGALYGGNRPVTRTVDPIPRPSSVHEAIPAPATRPRAASQNLNLVPPTDGSETDPLQRWKGAPIFAWGVGGTFVSSFPQDVPRYGMNQALPMIHRAAGEVLVKNIKEIQPLDERLAKFPGPLKGKSKKKEVLAWLTAGIEGLERSLPSSINSHVGGFTPQPSHEDKRLEERVLLWKILHLFIEHDGVLEGNPAVEKAVRDVLSPHASEPVQASTSESLTSPGVGYPGYQGVAGSQHTQADAVDSTVVEQIRKNLLLGEKEKAVWDAVDKRLWGHAFLIAGAASRELFKKVAQEFVRKEVNTPGLHNESLAALYEVLSGNHEECVDELVPVHARAGLHLMTTTQAANSQTKDNELGGLDKWRETLGLILSNRSVDDVQAINSLGGLLSGYGRAEAAHVCFLFSRGVTVFGGLDDPAANFVLLGADHKRQADSFAKETDAVLLSEVYEYGLSLTGASNLGASNSPHLAAYKLQHAMVLAEYGLRDKALQYCESIAGAIGAQTRRSPYYHPLLETAVEDLMKRLKSAPKEESNSWIPKPSMNKVSDTVWNRFNKFVAGDENEGAGAGPDGEAGAESGPFSRIAGGTPTISRPPSAGGGGPMGATGMEMFGGQSNLNLAGATYGVLNGSAAASSAAPPPPMMPPTRAASRYAPGGATSQQQQPTQANPIAGLASPPMIHSPYEHGGYTPLGMSPGSIIPPAPAAAASVSSSFNPYEPASNSSPYAPASSSRRVSSDQSVSGEATSAAASAPLAIPTSSTMPTLARKASEMSLGSYSRPGLSRKSSYAPLTNVEPTPPTLPTESSSYNPYAPPNEPAAAPAAAATNGSASVSPYAPAASPYTPAGPTVQVPPETESENKEEEHPATEAATPSYGYQAPSYGYEPPTMSSFEPASNDELATGAMSEDGGAGEHLNGNANGNGYSAGGGGGGGGYEPPSFQPYSYEPPSYEPVDAEGGGDGAADDDELSAPKDKGKAKSFMDDDGDDNFSMPAPPKQMSASEKSREEKDRENAEMFRKIAEEEAKRAAAEKEAKAKKGWGLTSWWGKKDAGGLGSAGAGSSSASGGSGGGHGEPPKAVRANLGEKSSFYFDPELKRWINKNASPEDQTAKSTPPPPPPRSNPQSATSTPAPPMSGLAHPPPPTSVPPLSGSAPPMMPAAMARTASAASNASGPPTGPPSRPATSMGEANSIDDLLGATPGPRKAGAKKGRKSGRYVDVMAK